MFLPHIFVEFLIYLHCNHLNLALLALLFHIFRG